MKNELKYSKKNLTKAILKQHRKHQNKISQTLKKSSQIKKLQNLNDLSLPSAGDKDVASSGSGSGGSANGMEDYQLSQDLPKSLERKINNSLSLSQLANQMDEKEDNSKIKETLGNLEKGTLKNIQSEMGIPSDSNNHQETLDKIIKKYQNNPAKSTKDVHNLVEKEIRSLDKTTIHERKIDAPKKPEFFKKLKPFNLSTSILIPIIIILSIIILLIITRKDKNKNLQEKNLKHSKKQVKKTRKNLLDNCQHLKSYTPKDNEEAIDKIIFLYNSLMNYIVQSGYDRPSHLTPDEYENDGLSHICKNNIHSKFVTDTFVETLYGKKSPPLDDFHKYVNHIQMLCLAIDQNLNQASIKY